MHRLKLTARIGFIASWSLLLLLALRFGARTYPGVWHPESEFLNWLLNGTTLFTLFGYDLVLVAAGAAAARISLRGDSFRTRRIRLALAWLQGVAVALAFAIICYGVRWAILMERLPWQDG